MNIAMTAISVSGLRLVMDVPLNKTAPAHRRPSPASLHHQQQQPLLPLWRQREQEREHFTINQSIKRLVLNVNGIGIHGSHGF